MYTNNPEAMEYNKVPDGAIPKGWKPISPIIPSPFT